MYIRINCTNKFFWAADTISVPKIRAHQKNSNYQSSDIQQSFSSIGKLSLKSWIIKLIGKWSCCGVFWEQKLTGINTLKQLIPTTALLACSSAWGQEYSLLAEYINPFSAFFGGSFIVISLIYFFPTMICLLRKHNNKIPIFIVNIILGWTFIGWVVALVWSFTSNTENQKVTQQQNTVNHNDNSLINQLERLKKLHDEHILNDEEFEEQKHNLLKERR